MATSRTLFCDTNFLLDVYDVDRVGHDDAIALLWYVVENRESVRLVASISSFKDAFYILTRLYHDSLRAHAAVEGLMGKMIEPVDLFASYGEEALNADEPDFEDALIGISAEHEGAAVLITRDADAFAKCAVPSMSAASFLQQEGFDYSVISW